MLHPNHFSNRKIAVSKLNYEILQRKIQKNENKYSASICSRIGSAIDAAVWFFPYKFWMENLFYLI